MEGKQPIISLYLDMKFLAAYLNNQPSDSLSQDYLYWLEFYRFLMENDNYQVITPNKGKEMNLSDFKLLLSSLRDPRIYEEFFDGIGEIDIDSYQINLEYNFKSQLKNPYSLIFLEAEEKQLDKLVKHGFLFFSSTTFTKTWPYLITEQSFSVNTFSRQRGLSLKSWKDMSGFTVTCNEIFICDPYLAMSEEEVEVNLFPLLEVLLDSRVHTTELTILYASNKTKSQEVKDHSRLNPKYFKKKLENHIRSFHAHTVNIRIIKADSAREIHDRIVITNYFSISSGRSFQFFSLGKRDSTKSRLRVTHSTTVKLSPFLSPGQLHSTQIILKLAGKVIQRTPMFKSGKHLKIGKNQSRLLRKH